MYRIRSHDNELPLQECEKASQNLEVNLKYLAVQQNSRKKLTDVKLLGVVLCFDSTAFLNIMAKRFRQF